VQPNTTLVTFDQEAVQYTDSQTAVPAGNETVTDVPFENQSDDVPAPIDPVLFEETVVLPSGATYKGKVVHPLLDLGPLGVLKYLPDHMHEGRVLLAPNYDQAVLPKQLLQGGELEFPKDAVTGAYPQPAIIATGTSIPEAIWIAYEDSSLGFSGDPKPARSVTYGVAGAYDGYSLGIGRVAVDSTWHHFFDVNLIGDPDILAEQSKDPDADSDPRSQGFTFSQQGRQYLQMFDAYYQNLASWLASPQIIYPRFPHTLWRLLSDGHLREALAGSAIRTPAARKGIGHLALGHINRAGLTRTGLIDHILALIDYQILPPWFAGEPGSRPVLGAAYAHHMISHVLGVALMAVHDAQAAITKDDNPVERLDAVVRAAALDGLGAWRDELASTGAIAPVKSTLDRLLAPHGRHEASTADAVIGAKSTADA
jgi:hypothetical protein